jgi:hypothetical protein
MSDEDPNDYTNFWKNVNECAADLPPHHKALLLAFVRLGWAATADADQLSTGAFTESFTSGQADLITNYQPPAGGVQLIPHFFRGFIKLT